MKIIVYKDNEGKLYSPFYNKDDNAYWIAKENLQKITIEDIIGLKQLKEELPWDLRVYRTIASEKNPEVSINLIRDDNLTKELRNKINFDVLKRLEHALAIDNGLEGAREIIRRMRNINECLSDILDDNKNKNFNDDTYLKVSRFPKVFLQIDSGEEDYYAELTILGSKLNILKGSLIYTELVGDGITYFPDNSIERFSNKSFHVRDIKYIEKAQKSTSEGR